MLETPHVIVGAAIATKIPNPWISIPLVFLSHLAIETVPHWNPHLNTEMAKHGHVTKKSTVIVAVDATIALISGLVIANQVMPNVNHAITIIACCFVAALPDFVEGPYFFLNMRWNWVQKWMAFQKSIQTDTGVFWGLLTQVLIILASIWWIS